MKKFLIPTLALMLATSASADSYPYLSFQTADGSVVSLSSSGLNLTVEGSQLVAQNEEGSSKFALADLSRMFFSKQVRHPSPTSRSAPTRPRCRCTPRRACS